MPNEQQNQNQNQEQNPNLDYIEEIAKLKANTVPRAQYDAKVEENKKLLETLIDGQPAAAAAGESKEKPSLEELKNALYHPDHKLNNLEYVSRSVEYRDALLEETGEDCYVAVNPQDPNFDEAAARVKAQNVADVYHQCIDACNGNAAVFTAQLASRMNDIALPRRK